MSTLLSWIAAAVLLLLLFVALLLVGIMKKNLKLVIASVVVFAGFLGVGGIAGYKVLNKSYHVLKEATKQRTGSELYTSVFGAPATDCVTVFGSSEPVIPAVGDKLVLCFRTCREEADRILAQRNYEVVKRPTTEVTQVVEKKCCVTYFSQQRFGDTVLEYMASSAGSVYTVYMSADSTHVYYMEVKH